MRTSCLASLRLGSLAAAFRRCPAAARSADARRRGGAKPAEQPAAEAKPQPEKNVESRDGRPARPACGRPWAPSSSNPSTPATTTSPTSSTSAGLSAASRKSPDGPSGEKLNGITCLCWNLPCGGYQPLTLADGHLAARVGYGYQDVPSQLAAMLALARVAAEYPARADAHSVRTVADLIESEKLACRSGTDLSLRLIALAHYVKDATWKNLAGRGVVGRADGARGAEAVRRPAPQASATRLLALSWALDSAALHKLPLDGRFRRGQEVRRPSAGTTCWRPRIPTAVGAGPPAATPPPPGRDRRRARMARAEPPRKRLEDPRIVQSVQYLGRPARARSSTRGTCPRWAAGTSPRS